MRCEALNPAKTEEANMEVLSKQFEELRKAIEPSEPRKKDAKKADDPVREHLEADPSFAEHHITTFLYGSYKRRTAICDIKDVDLVVVTNYTTDEKPHDVLSDLKDSLADLYDEPDLSDQRRSIRINRPLSDDPDCELTLDVIPAIYADEEGGPLWVPDREKGKWVKSHPQGHIDNTSQFERRLPQWEYICSPNEDDEMVVAASVGAAQSIGGKSPTKTEGLLD
jgi:hypothetical protein